MRNKRSRTTSSEEVLAGVAHQPKDVAIHAKETRSLQQVQVEHARARALGRALADASNHVALHERPTLLLPTIAVRDGVAVTVDEISAELVVEPEDGLAVEIAELHKERDALRGKVASLEQELAIQRDHLIDKQREMELLLPWLPTEDAAQTSRVSCSEVLQRIQPLRDLIKLVSSPSGTMSDQDKLRWLLRDAESVVTGLRTLCSEQ